MPWETTYFNMPLQHTTLCALFPEPISVTHIIAAVITKFKKSEVLQLFILANFMLQNREFCKNHPYHTQQKDLSQQLVPLNGLTFHSFTSNISLKIIHQLSYSAFISIVKICNKVKKWLYWIFSTASLKIN